MNRRHLAAILFLVASAAINAVGHVQAQPATGAERKSSTAKEAVNPYPGRFPAPSLDGGTDWLNSSGPIAIQDLRGKVVLLDFWTYCCINCIHILPDLKYLEEKYPNELVVIGVHSAKFENEKESENIRQAIMRYNIAHPVINDSRMVVARKYGFNAWPTQVLIDPEGNFVGSMSGEGHRELFDKVIGDLAKFHEAKGTLDRTPFKFHLEQEKADPTPLRFPGKILADAAGKRLFITDSNHNRIVVTDLDGKLQYLIGSGEIGTNDGAVEEATFDHPQGVALVDEKLYVADTENHMIRVVDLQTKQVTTLAGTGEQARVRATFGREGNAKKTALNSPWAMVELKGMLYVAMAGPHQIWRHKIGSETIGPFIGSGREDILDGSLRDAALAQPSDIVTDGKSLFHVDSEGSAVRRNDITPPAGVFTVVGPHEFPNGRSLFEFGDIDGVGDEVRMQHPIGMAYYEGMLYVADTYNDKIKLVDPVKRTSVSWLGTGDVGKGLDPVEMAEPAGLSIALGFMYIADTNNHRILKTDLKTKKTIELVVQGLEPPVQKKADPNELTAEAKDQAPAVQIGSKGPLKAEFSFEFAEGYHLNQAAPLNYRVSLVDGSEAIIDAAELNLKKRADAKETTASFAVPLSGKTGKATLKLTINYQYCKDGTGGLCKFGAMEWLVPVTVTEAGESTVKFTVKP